MHTGRTFVLGDIHGAYRALRQCLERAEFNKQHDHLIFLGDVCDGWPETKSCIDELITIKHLTCLLGNHDFWTLEWMDTGHLDNVWLTQGGMATIESYKGEVLPTHHAFLKKAVPYFLLQNKLFVHAGIEHSLPVENQSLQTLLWDRTLARTALDLYHKEIQGKLTNYDEVYLGHTPIPYPTPIQSSEIWLMDTGAGWSGVLSIMNIDTKEIFTSDPVPSLYPGVQGRKKF